MENHTNSAVKLRDEIIDAIAEYLLIHHEPHTKELVLSVREGCELMKLGRFWNDELLKDMQRYGCHAFERSGLFGLKVRFVLQHEKFIIN